MLRFGTGRFLNLSGLQERGQAILLKLYWEEGIVVVVIEARFLLGHQVFYCQIDHCKSAQSLHAQGETSLIEEEKVGLENWGIKGVGLELVDTVWHHSRCVRERLAEGENEGLTGYVFVGRCEDFASCQNVWRDDVGLGAVWH